MVGTDRSTSMFAGFGDVGAVSDDYQMNFQTEDSQIATGLVKIMNRSFRDKFSWPNVSKKRTISRCRPEDTSPS